MRWRLSSPNSLLYDSRNIGSLMLSSSLSQSGDKVICRSFNYLSNVVSRSTVHFHHHWEERTCWKRLYVQGRKKDRMTHHSAVLLSSRCRIPFPSKESWGISHWTVNKVNAVSEKSVHRNRTRIQGIRFLKNAEADDYRFWPWNRFSIKMRLEWTFRIFLPLWTAII